MSSCVLHSRSYAVSQYYPPDVLYVDAYINAIFPITSGQYWYISAYFGLLFFMPFLNSGIQQMNKTQLIVSVGLMLGAFVVFPLFLPDFSVGDSYGIAGGSSTLWLAVLYILGAVLNKYHILQKMGKVHGYVLFAVAAVFSIVFMAVFSKLEETVPFTWFGAKRFMVSTSITMLLEVVVLLTIFEKVKLGATRDRVLYLAPSTLGVYLFHELPLLKYSIPLKLFDGFADKPIFEMIGLILGSSCVIYTIGTCIDLIRRVLFQKLHIKQKCNELAVKIETKIEKISSLEMEE